MSRRKKQTPTFSSRDEEAAFWETHDTTDYELEEVKEPIVLSPSLRATILRRGHAMRAREWLPIPGSQVRHLKAAARRKGTSWELLAYQWLEERLRTETSGA